MRTQRAGPGGEGRGYSAHARDASPWLAEWLLRVGLGSCGLHGLRRPRLLVTHI